MGRQALAQATTLESAIYNFQIEYGSLPNVGNHVRTDSPDGVKLLNILLGSEKGTPKQNPRDIRFLAIREAKGRKNGLQYSETGNHIEGLYDPWGNPFIVELDVTNEDKLRFQFRGRLKELPGRSTTAYSPGIDGKVGTSDDVITW